MMQPTLFPLPSPKERGMATAIDHANEDWKRRFSVEATLLVGSGKPFTSEDVVRSAGQPPRGTSPNAVGAMMNKVVHLWHLKRVGFVEATRGSRHSGIIGQWQRV